MESAELGGESHFAAELKAHRAAKGWTQVELGREIGFSGSFVSDVERDERAPSSDFAQRCDKAFGLPQTFERIHAEIQRNAFPAFFAPIVPIEQEAERIHGWELGAVPGLLQTQRYARSVIQARSPRDDDEAIERMVSARMERQEILSRERPPLLWYVIHEGVLRHVVGDEETMAEQLDRLIKSASMPGIIIQVLPFTANDHAGVEGPIVLYDRPAKATVAYTECFAGGRLIEGQDEVADLTTVIGMIRAAALSPRDSIALMRTIRRERAD